MRLDQSFGWRDVWAYFNRSSPAIKAHLLKEVIGDGWLYGQSARVQFEVLEFAPREFTLHIKAHLNLDALIELKINPYI